MNFCSVLMLYRNSFIISIFPGTKTTDDAPGFVIIIIIEKTEKPNIEKQKENMGLLR